MKKEILFGEEVRSKMQAGVDKLANAVKITLGPKGRNVIVDKGIGKPLITNDGYSIAKEINLEDAYENMGAQIVKEVTTRTNDVSGDGTTTATVLAQAIIKEGLKNVAAGANPILLRSGMNRAVKDAVECIVTIAKPVKCKEDIARVATISTADETIGELIADAMDKVGLDGVITLEEGSTMSTELEVVEGMDFDKGYISPYMIDDEERMTATLNNPIILVTDKKISFLAEIMPIMEMCIEESKPLMIIADDVDGEALSTLVVNNMRGNLRSVAIKAPGFGDRKKQLLKDIAIVCGAKFISADLETSLAEVKLDELGQASTVKITDCLTTIVNGASIKSELDDRIAQVRNQLESSSDFDREFIQSRLAKLAGGVAIIKVGAATETEMNERKLRIEDGINATKAAVQEGIVAGGGTTYVMIEKELTARDNKFDTHDEEIGYKIVTSSLLAPMKQIAANAGIEGGVVINKVQESDSGFGYDAYKDEYVDMIKAGIVDPAKVTRSALQNAVSVGGTFLTAEAGIITIETK